MNSRIQELIDQSSTMSWEVDHAVTTVDAHALAERIVRECMDVVRGINQEHYGGDTVVNAAEEIAEHFGVEE